MLNNQIYALGVIKRVALPLLAVVAVMGCEPPKTPALSNPVEKFPLVVSDETRAIAIDVPTNGGAVSSVQADGLRRFVQDYLDRGKGTIIVETTALPSGKAATAKHAAKVSEYLGNYGIRSNEITLIPGSINGASPSTVNMTFTASKVSVPTCGKWQSSSSFTWTNRTHENFGCTYRRNLALMVADPADLVRSKTLDRRDPELDTYVIDNYGQDKGWELDTKSWDAW